jgi:hypothetical protein
MSITGASSAWRRGNDTGSGRWVRASTTVSDFKKSSTRSRGTRTVSLPPATWARRS